MGRRLLRDGFDQVDVAVISRTFPRANIRKILEKHNKLGERKRSLPNDLLVYYVICLGLFMHANLQEVLHYMVEGLRYISSFRFPKIIGKSGISQARTRLGSKVMEDLYKAHAKPIATEKTKGCWYHGLRLVAFDGSVLDLADEDGVRDYFGGSKGGAFPQARMMALFECGTHIMFGAKIAPYKTAEKPLARDMLNLLEPDMLCLADRGFHSFEMLEAVGYTGSKFLFRILNNTKLEIEKRLPDGSYLSHLSNRRIRDKGEKGIKVRVIEYEMQDSESKHLYRLVTNLFDHEEMPAKELAHLYHERWEAENILDELKTHLRGGTHVRLRSKTPDLVHQEFYGMMCAHFAIRGIMHEAALAANEDPDRLSFTHTIHVLRRKIPVFAAFSPVATKTNSSTNNQGNP